MPGELKLCWPAFGRVRLISEAKQQGDIHLKSQGKGSAKLLNAEKFGFSANLVNNKIPFDSKIW
jgi:hypothetical protein